MEIVMNEQFDEALRQAEESYNRYLAASTYSFAAEYRVAAEPIRSESYPVDFALDERKVHAILG